MMTLSGVRNSCERVESSCSGTVFIRLTAVRWATALAIRRRTSMLSNGFSFEMPSLFLLEKHRPQPSLLHGDLWSGNAGFTPEGPVIFDPGSKPHATAAEVQPDRQKLPP